jgi:hypothetical protein
MGQTSLFALKHGPRTLNNEHDEIGMTETVPTTTLAITFEELLATVFPPTGRLRLVAANGNDSFYRRYADGRWLVLGPERAGLDAFITASGANVTFSPVAWRAPAILRWQHARACGRGLEPGSVHNSLTSHVLACWRVSASERRRGSPVSTGPASSSTRAIAWSRSGTWRLP